MKTIEIENCIDCPHHEIIIDPDPYDSFCSDDIAVLCSRKDNFTSSKSYATGKLYDKKPITISCRPYNKRKECVIPNWCPL